MSAAPVNQPGKESRSGPEVVTDFTMEVPEPRRPTLRVVRGDATPEEIAAILAVVAGRSTPAPEDRLAQQRSAWSDRAAQLGAAPSPGPGAWRSAAKL